MTTPSTPHYTVLARRFRPQTFSDVVGQEHVGQALRNAIRSGRVAHAYLFTGARGVGKTSSARVFAKALNCPNADDGVPCNACEICQGIAAGDDIDVLEIDGASNRGIEDIRTLRANVNVRSMRSPYKVYIIDEVHMLTKDAFNALLKTLEEPPANVKFVFCTTEPGKVPDTILSRCQRFDFGLISVEAIAAQLANIATAEQVAVADEALELVARRAAGSMRDAQSLFDQLLAFGHEQVEAADVHRLLGTAPDDRLVDIVQALIDQDQAGALKRLDDALAGGVRLENLTDQLLEYCRDLLITGVKAADVALLSVAERTRPQLQEQVNGWGLETAATAMQILADTKTRMQRVHLGRALLDLALVRICLLERLDNLALLGRQPLSSLPQPQNSPQTPRSSPAHRPTPGTPPSPPEVVQSVPSKTLPLTEATLNDVWSQIIEKSADASSKHFRNAGSIAIIGPNALELSFPRSYVFSKNYCERPETLRRLAELVQEITGQVVEFSITTDPDSPPAKAVAGKSIEATPERLNSVSQDPFVEQALSLFGGTLVSVRPATERPER